MANTTISNASAIAACDSVVDRIDLGTGTAEGRLNIYSGTQPTNPDVAVTSQVLLAQLNLSNPAFGAAADANPGGRGTANSITDDSAADADGVASWFRIIDRDGTAILDGDVTATGGGGDLQMGSVSVTTGNVISITSWTITMPET